jgi:chromate reductase
VCVLTGRPSLPIPQPEILVFRAHEKFEAQGKLIDEKTAEFLKKYLVAFLEWVKRSQN